MQTKVLLDECVPVRQRDIERHNTTLVYHKSIFVVGQGAPDHEVMNFAKANNYLLVTQDAKLIIRCLDSDTQVALYSSGKAYKLKIENVITLPDRKALGAPIKIKNAERKPSHNLFSRLRNALSIKK